MARCPFWRRTNRCYKTTEPTLNTCKIFMGEHPQCRSASRHCFLSICLFIYLFIHSLTHSFIPSFIYSFPHSFAHSLIHSFTHLSLLMCVCVLGCLTQFSPLLLWECYVEFFLRLICFVRSLSEGGGNAWFSFFSKVRIPSGVPFFLSEVKMSGRLWLKRSHLHIHLSEIPWFWGVTYTRPIMVWFLQTENLGGERALHCFLFSWLFIYSFTHSLIHSFIHQFVHSFIHPSLNHAASVDI